MVADAAAIQVASPGSNYEHGCTELFDADMMRSVPLSRWDCDSPSGLSLGGKAPVRFGGFLSGIVSSRC